MPTLSWDLVGGDPAPGDPGAYADLAGSLSDTAERAAEAHSRLSRLGEGVDSSIWRGEAADAFREKIQDLPPKLEKLHESYETASRALAEYGRVLADLQPRARRLLEEAADAEAEEAAQQQRRDEAQAQQSADPLTAGTGSATAPFDRAIDQARGQRDDARRLIDDIREERESAEGRVLAGLGRAHDLGIKNKGWFQKALSAVDEWVDDHADFLQAVSGALKIVSAVAGLLSFIPVLAPICMPIALAAGGAALLLDATLCATGNGDWKALAVDAALMVLPGAGKLLSAGLRGTRAGGAVARMGSTIRPLAPRGKALAVAQRAVKADPVDVASGEVVLSQADVRLAGALPLVLSRTHVSSYREGRSFGPSWASTLDQRLEVDDAGVCYAAADGMVLVYPTPALGASVWPVEGPRWPLARTDDGGYTVTVPERGQTLHFAADPTGGEFVLPLSAVTDRNGDRIDFDHDADGTISEVRHSGGYRVGVESTGGRIRALRLRDPDGGDGDVELVRYGYDEAGQLTEVINSSGLPLRFAYDPAGRMVRWEDRNGAWYGYTYDDYGRCVRASGSGGCLEITFTYDPLERVTVATNSLGQTTSFHLNDLGQVVREVDPLGHATVSEWDRYDRLLTRIDRLGRMTRYRYDDDGNLVGITRPDGSHVTAEYNELRLPVTVVDPDGAVWQREFDWRGNLTALVDPIGARTTYDYDQRGHLARVTDPLGQSRQLEMNRAGLPVSATDPTGATTDYDRDAFGRVIAVTDPLGGVTRLGWTVEGKPAWRTLPDGTTERWASDGEGNLVEHVDGAGHVSRTEIGAFDLAVAQTGPDGARLEFTYDTELRLVAVTNPDGLVWRYDYDPAGNLITETDFNGRVLRYAHDPAGQLVERTNGAGQTTRYLRDPLGNVVEQRSGEALATFSYDPAGRIVSTANAEADLVFERDPLGRVLSETCNGRTVTSSYDVLGRRLRRRTPSGAESAWEYDPNDQPVALHAGGHTLRFGYDAAGREVERLLGGAGTVLAQTWDANHRLRSQTLTAAGSALQPAPAGNDRLVQRRSYRYRPDGHLLGIADHLSGDRQFDLDPAGQITAVHGAGWTERYAYDPAGNVTEADWPTNPQVVYDHQDSRGEREYAGTVLRRAGGVRYEHDDQGRVTLRQHKRLSERPRTWHYTWDADDRLTGVVTPDGQQWRYRYDPLGRRIAKQRLAADGATPVEQVDFTWDGTVLAEQTHTCSGDGTGRTTVWEWEPRSFRPLSQAERVPSADAPQEWIDEQFYAIVTDLAGTPTELVEPDGDLAWHPRTTVWGTVVAGEAGGASTPLRFPGQYHDPETGLNYNYLRYYEPASQRYQANDPLGLGGGFNPHAYVPNPLRSADPLGLMACDDIAVIGRQWDTAVAREWPGHDVLHIPDWTLAKNDQWVGEIVKRQAKVYVGSPQTKANLWDSVANRETVFARELRQFEEAGYVRQGDYLLPPGGGS